MRCKDWELRVSHSAIEIATVEEDNRGTGADHLVVKPPARDRRKSCVGGWHGRGSLVTRADRDHNTGNGCIANLEEKCEANYIKLSVAPDGKSYTVSIPATGHKRTYRTKS